MQSLKIKNIGPGINEVLFQVGDQELQGVRACDVLFRPDDLVIATIELIPDFDELNAVVILDQETLERSAEAQGYKLVTVEQAEEDARTIAAAFKIIDERSREIENEKARPEKDFNPL